MKLNELADNGGARKTRTRVGRGIGSGKGKTSARGGKGQTARSGVALNGFEGGQTPLAQRLPKRGFNNINRIEYEVLNLSDLNAMVEAKKFTGSEISLADFRAMGALKGLNSRLKILGNGELKHKLIVEADAASQSAIAAFKKLGGELKLTKVANA